MGEEKMGEKTKEITFDDYLRLLGEIGSISCRLEHVDNQLKEIRVLVWMIAEILKTIKTR
ncbi:MAG: hypothetical protein QXT92_00030 [Nitrososphaerota archaeon]